MNIHDTTIMTIFHYSYFDIVQGLFLSLIANDVFTENPLEVGCIDRYFIIKNKLFIRLQFFCNICR